MNSVVKLGPADRRPTMDDIETVIEENRKEREQRRANMYQYIKKHVLDTPAEPSPEPELPPSWLTRKYIRWSIKLKAIIDIIKER